MGIWPSNYPQIPCQSYSELRLKISRPNRWGLALSSPSKNGFYARYVMWVQRP